MKANTEMWSKENFISVLKRYRHEKNITQAQLGERLGFALSTIRRWESSKDSSMPAMCDVPVIANKLNMTIDELITGTPTQAVNLCRATGLSASAIETLQQMKRSPYLRVIDRMLQSDWYFEASFQLRDLVNIKKALFSGELKQDYSRTRNTIRGAQSEMAGAYSSLIKDVTNQLAKKALEAEGKKSMENWQLRGYDPLTDDEQEAIFDEQWDYAPMTEDEIDAFFDKQGGE